MIIDKCGRYVLIEDLVVRGSISIKTLPAGTTIEITQIDREYHKVIGPRLGDWVYWSLPVLPEPPPSRGDRGTETDR